MDITYKGLSLGDDTEFIVTGIDGWETRPEITNGSTPHPRRLGSQVGGLSSVKRVVTVDLTISPTAKSDYLTTAPKRQLQQIMSLEDAESPLMMSLDYGLPPEIIFARVTAFDLPIARGYGRSQEAFIEWTATDPRRYSLQVNASQTGLPVAVRGMAYPIKYGRYPELITPANRGEAVVQNVGNSRTPATFVITGPVRNPTITVAGNGGPRRVQFNVNLVAGERLTANTSDGTVWIGGAARQGITSGALMEDMELPAGTSTVALGGQGSNAARLDVSWRDATL